MRRAWMLAASALILTKAVAQPPSTGGVQIRSADQPLSVWFAVENDYLVGRFTLVLENHGPDTIVGPFWVVARGEDQTIYGTTVVPKNVKIEKDSIRAFPFAVRVKGDELPRFMTLVAWLPSAAASPKLIEIRGTFTSPKTFLRIFLPAVAIGLIVPIMGLFGRKTYDSNDWHAEMGAPKWDFTTSWASNITVVGGVLGTVLSFTALPAETKYLPKTMYVSLNLLWTVAIALAPILYNFFRRPADPELDTTNASGTLRRVASRVRGKKRNTTEKRAPSEQATETDSVALELRQSHLVALEKRIGSLVEAELDFRQVVESGADRAALRAAEERLREQIDEARRQDEGDLEAKRRDLLASLPPTFRGYVGAFLIASGVTLGGVSGQLLTLGMLFNELEAGHVLPALATNLLWGLLDFILLGLAVYGYRTIAYTIEHQVVRRLARGPLRQAAIDAEVARLARSVTPVANYRRIEELLQPPAWGTL